jgi:hypothetical protein
MSVFRMQLRGVQRPPACERPVQPPPTTYRIRRVRSCLGVPNEAARPNSKSILHHPTFRQQVTLAAYQPGIEPRTLDTT